MITESRSAVTQGQKQPGRWVGRRDPKGPKETSEGDRHVPVLIVLMCVDMCVWVCGCVCKDVKFYPLKGRVYCSIQLYRDKAIKKC